MTGKDMLRDIQNLDAAMIEEAEFGTFHQGKAKVTGKKKLLLLLAAALAAGSMIAAAAYTRWPATMQFGSYGGAQPSEEIKKQAEQSGLSVIPSTAKNENAKTVTAEDNGITVTLTQTVMDQYGGRAVFRIEGLKLEEGQAPWAWWDFQIDGKSNEQLHMSWGTQFFNGITTDAEGNPIYVKNGKPVVDTREQGWLLDYQLGDGSVEFSVDFAWSENPFGKEMVFTFTGFGIQGEKFEDEDIMTVPGKWELRWTLEGTTEAPEKWTPNAKIGHWDVTLVEAEIGQYSMKLTYRIGDEYKDPNDFVEKEGWDPTPASIRLKDGTDLAVHGSMGGASWDSDPHVYTSIDTSLDTILDPSQIAGMSFFSGYELDEQGHRVHKPYYYIPFE